MCEDVYLSGWLAVYPAWVAVFPGLCIVCSQSCGLQLLQPRASPAHLGGLWSFSYNRSQGYHPGTRLARQHSQILQARCNLFHVMRIISHGLPRDASNRASEKTGIEELRGKRWNKRTPVSTDIGGILWLYEGWKVGWELYHIAIWIMK